MDKSLLKLGEPLRWDIYNAAGSRIFRKGFIFRTKESLLRLKEIDLFREVSEGTVTPEQAQPESTTPATRHRKVMYEFASGNPERQQQIGGNIFYFLDYCIASEATICKQILNGATDQAEALLQLIEEISFAYRCAADACLGAVHMDYAHPLSSLQPVYTAILCLMMADGLNLDEHKRNGLVGAALTANLGMYKYFDILVNRNSQLDAEEQAYIHAHPQASNKYLRENGIEDKNWLTTVLQHHERGDGSGYPARLTHDEILPEASILAAIDTYIAMVTPRAYRKPLPPKVALQRIYKAAVARDDVIGIGLIKQLGIYPPGTLVRLANQEIGVVVERNQQESVAPRVAVIGNVMGACYSEYPVRDSASPTYRIIDVYQSASPVQIDMNKLWSEPLPGISLDDDRSLSC